MLNQIRGGIVKRIGEAIRFAVPFGGINVEGVLELIGVDGNRVSSHEAFQIGGLSEELAIGGVSTSITFPADSGRFIRMLATADCYVRLDALVPIAANNPAADNVSIFFPFGSTLFIVIPDSTQISVLSAKAVGASGILYASIVL